MVMKFEDEESAISRTLAGLGLLIDDSDTGILCTKARMMGHAQLQRVRNVSEGKLQYTVSVIAHPDLELRGFTATLYRVSDLLNERFISEMDLNDLYKALNNTDWYLTDNNVEATTLHSTYLHVLEGINTMQAIAATALLVNYWVGTPQQEFLYNLPELRSISSSYYFPVNNSLNDFTASQAYNIVAGRAVLKFQNVVTDPSSFFGVWKELKNGKLVDIPSFSLDDILEKYEVKEYRDEIKGQRLIYDLLNGDKVACHIPGPEGDRKVFIAADPSNNDLNLYQPDGTRLVILKMEKEDERARKKEVQQWKRKPGKRL
jgi:hypothetical protein